MITVREYIENKQPDTAKRIRKLRRDLTEEITKQVEVPKKLMGIKTLMEERSGVEY